MEISRRDEQGRVLAPPSTTYAWIHKIPEVQNFLDTYQEKTVRNYKSVLGEFLTWTEKDVQELLALDERNARNIVLSFIAHKRQTAPGRLTVIFNALTQWYLYHGKKLLWIRGQKIRHSPIKPKHTPSNDEVWRIAEASMASSRPRTPRNKAMILYDFVTGMRSNAMLSSRWGLLKGYSEDDCPIPIKVWCDSYYHTLGKNNVWVIDDKLTNYNYDHIYTFMAREAFVLLQEHRDWMRQKFGFDAIADDKPMFTSLGCHTDSREQLAYSSWWDLWKIGLRLTPIKPETCAPHSLRRSFKSVCKKAGVDFEAREAMMGHTLPGSSGKYWDNHDPDMVVSEYLKCDWSSAGTYKPTKVEKEIERLRQEKELLEQRVRDLEGGNQNSMEKKIEERILAKMKAMYALKMKEVAE